MQTVDGMIAEIIRREGGYNDIGADRGGATNQGVSLRYAKGVGLDLDGDGDTDKDDIRLVTPEIAAELYREDFFEQPRINLLPEDLQAQVFDCAVNHGPPRAVMFVQEVVNKAGFGPIAVDGVLGPHTRRCVEAAHDQMGPFFNNAVMHERINFYKIIVDSDPSQKVFIKGWIRRAKEFEVPTDA